MTSIFINMVIILVIIVCVILAIRSSVAHYKGEGGCCGGSCPPVKKVHKKLNEPVVRTIKVEIQGMHCNHCKTSIESAINSIEGAYAEVNLDEAYAIVKETKVIEDDIIKKAVEDAGFTVSFIVRE